MCVRERSGLCWQLIWFAPRLSPLHTLLSGLPPRWRRALASEGGGDDGLEQGEAWERVAQCHRARGDVAAAVGVYRSLVQQVGGPEDPGYVAAVVKLSEVLREQGQDEEAQR